MYIEHFGLNEKPFSISPDPRYLYLSRRHADALAHLLYGIAESGGFIQLTGEVGTGKTTLIRSVLGQLPEKTEIALILNPQLSKREFLQAICQELVIPFAPNDTTKVLIDRLNTRLLETHAADRRVVLIVDEAQTMSPDLLEQVRLLTNLETDKKKLLQIILIGQPELRDLLASSEMRQVAQRITARYHLEPLSAAETALYVEHRMKVAGGRPEVFSKRAVQKLFKLSRGIPRLINVIADRSLLAAYASDIGRIRARLVGRAAREVYGRGATAGLWPIAAPAALLVPTLWVVSRSDGPPSESLELALLETPAAPAEAPGGVEVPPGVTDPSSATPPHAGPAEALATASRAREPEPEVVEPPSLTERLAARTFDTNAAAATEALFGLWDVRYSVAGGAICDQAVAQGLSCLWLDGGSLSELRRLNRPARLSLHDAQGAEHFVVLSNLGQTHATLAVANGSLKVGIAELTHFDYGRHLVLWRPAIDIDTAPLSEGARGPDVVWLRTGLEDAQGRALPSPEPDYFDAELADAVRDYQRKRGLVVDGVVGARTLVNLQTELKLIGVGLVVEAD